MAGTCCGTRNRANCSNKKDEIEWCGGGWPSRVVSFNACYCLCNSQRWAEYVLARRINQDPLESYFGHQRQKDDVTMLQQCLLLLAMLKAWIPWSTLLLTLKDRMSSLTNLRYNQRGFGLKNDIAWLNSPVIVKCKCYEFRMILPAYFAPSFMYCVWLMYRFIINALSCILAFDCFM